MTGEPPTLWVNSHRGPGGRYVASVTLGEDVTIPMGRDRAIAYAMTVLQAAARAEYEAVVYAQVVGKGGSVVGKGSGEAIAINALADLRADRPQLDDAVTAPLRFKPFIAARSKSAVVDLYLHGDLVCQLTATVARAHAMHVFDTVAVVDLDAAFYRYLTNTVEVDEQRAAAAVDDLRNWQAPNSLGSVFREWQPNTASTGTFIHRGRGRQRHR